MRWCILLLLFGVVYNDALDCGIESRIDGAFRRAIVSCLTRNMTLNSIFDFSTLTSEESTTIIAKNTETTTTKNNDSTQTSNYKKKSKRYEREVAKTKDIETTTTSDAENETEMETATTTDEPTSIKENCIIQCVLSTLELTDKDGFPEHQKIEEGLLEHAKGREMEDFFRDTTDKCFQKVNSESTKDACEFSLELVKCLADFGKENCGDWPAGNISLFNP
ncbi:hypothetical protein WA026_000260 [Henosepilachna vigintioctopunctata]|uniref:Uncharacterized protein n=1 Tax=Henosepilachna vigintioctopunctata TaxID=420089 RepID=A0AAW1V7S6_9CUCU